MENETHVIDHLFEWASCTCCGSNIDDIRYPIDTEYASRMSGIDIGDLGIGVAVCGNCGHESIQPVPKTAFLKAYYSRYMSMAKSGFYQERASDIIPDRFRTRYTPWLDRIRDILGGRQGSLLDVGAGLGMFLKLAREHGFAVQGVEPNKETADAVMDCHGIPIINSLFEEVRVSEQFDVVTMWDLLEHLAEPRVALEKAAGLVVPGGLLVMEIPARDSLLHNLAKAMYRFTNGRIRRPLYLVCGVHHLHYFDETDITNLLSQTGFEIRHVYRGETELASLYLALDGRVALLARLFNFSLAAVFMFARLIGRQNKLIVFAEKV